jgi:hypothetical protein
MNDLNIEKEKAEIDAMSHYDLCALWRFGSSDNKLLQGELGVHLKNRLFGHFGGFTPSISKALSW